MAKHTPHAVEVDQILCRQRIESRFRVILNGRVSKTNKTKNNLIIHPDRDLKLSIKLIADVARRTRVGKGGSPQS